MALPYRVLDDAELEVIHAATTYEIESPGLEKRFLKAYSETLDYASTFPQGGTTQQYPGVEVQAFHLSVFPYTVFAAVRADEVVIVAVAHQSREPGYWAERLDDVDKD